MTIGQGAGAPRALVAALLFVCCVTATSTNVLAEDLKGRWYLGGNLSFLSTTDNIRSNAALFLGSFGDDGLPGTADPNESLSCDDTGAFCDPRPDDLIGRESAIEEALKYDLTAGFGLTSWLSLQLDVSYFRGDVGPVDFYFSSVADPVSGIVSDQVNALRVGELTEIPISLSAIARFRKDSTLNPYVGIGAGMIFSEIDVGPEITAANARIQSFRIKRVSDEFNQDLVVAGAAGPEGRLPSNSHLLMAKVDDALEWHVTGGGEYFFNDRVSMIFDARYTFADQEVSILLSGEDQVNFEIFNESLFRGDGSLKFFNNPASAPSPFCVDSPSAPMYEQGAVGARNGCALPPGCSPGSPPPCPQSPTELPPTQRVTCEPNSVGDFDGDGIRPNDPDICYVGTPPEVDVVVQGGSIDLTGFSVAVGFRFHF